MFYLETTRLILVQTPVDVLNIRLQNESFVANVNLPSGRIGVFFPEEWPGDALAFFPMMLEHFSNHPDDISWGGTLIDRAERVAVGQMGFKGTPMDGAVEIGYGINPSYHNRGYATEMVQALTEWALSQPDVNRVVAECRVDNFASIRVLEKAGFKRTGLREDEEDGTLILWDRSA